MLCAPGLWNFRKRLNLAASLNREMFTRILDHVFSPMCATCCIVAAEACFRSFHGKEDVQLCLGERSIEFRNVNSLSYSTTTFAFLSPISHSERLFLSHPVTKAADTPECRRRQC